MIGSGMPSSQRSAPLPKPMMFSSGVCGIERAAAKKVPLHAFDRAYLTANPDAKALIHFLEIGLHQGRSAQAADAKAWPRSSAGGAFLLLISQHRKQLRQPAHDRRHQRMIVIVA